MRIVETVSGGLTAANWDKERGIVRNCKILGLESKNGRRYLDEAVGKAVRHYEGKFVYVDHSFESEPRKFLDKFGRFRNVHHKSGKGLFGDYHYNVKHAAAATFEGWLDCDPTAVGFSHVAEGKVRRGDDGVDEVYEIDGVESVDLVGDPASTKGIFESAGGRREPTLDDFLEHISRDPPRIRATPGGREPSLADFLETTTGSRTGNADLDRMIRLADEKILRERGSKEPTFEDFLKLVG